MTLLGALALLILGSLLGILFHALWCASAYTRGHREAYQQGWQDALASPGEEHPDG